MSVSTQIIYSLVSYPSLIDHYICAVISSYIYHTICAYKNIQIEDSDTKNQTSGVDYVTTSTRTALTTINIFSANRFSVPAPTWFFVKSKTTSPSHWPALVIKHDQTTNMSNRAYSWSRRSSCAPWKEALVASTAAVLGQRWEPTAYSTWNPVKRGYSLRENSHVKQV